MADIWVETATNDNGTNCLRIFDADESYTNLLESGMALRRAIHGETVTWHAPNTATSLTIYFPVVCPFSDPNALNNVAVKPVGNAPIQVTLGPLKAGVKGRYKYTIILTITLASGVVINYVEDPQIMVDTGSPFIITKTRSKTKPGKKKKK
jgi:hypothetical protein